MSQVALLIIDMQEDFFREDLAKERTKLCKDINQLSKLCREKNIPVIWISQCWSEDLSDAPLNDRKNNRKIVIKGTFGCKILSELNVLGNDLHVSKTRFSAYFKTGLEKLLEEMQIKKLIISGINTHACIRTTVIDAYMRDYEVIIPKECVSSYDKEHHKISLEYLAKASAKVINLAEICSKI